ncbi:MAG: 3-hydroxyacyl-CoA dehydrogenase/enoyl-CoA hydratase family protein [Planctomycetes bacterium]|nr:3-hydroxyacyl-CoA dehydrogenase/enoyl-CoA hydratase family protein [Planctomycetota bacterium]
MTIKSGAVIGAGTMGTGIAGQLANAGVPCVLLDVVPQGAGSDARSRSRLALEALERAAAGSPPALMDSADRALIEPGNIEDNLERIAGCDWIVEAVSEDLEVKRSLYRKVARHRKPDAIVSSNTSGLALSLLTEGLDEGFRRHFLVTHFFNPPRYMYLLEVVRGPETLPEVAAEIERFSDLRLGKGIVRAKDTPNFIANRIGVFCMGAALKILLEEGLTVEEVDEITGPAMGRPKTASFRLHDLVGIDVAVMVMDNARRLLQQDESRDLFEPPELLRRMVREGRLGRKTGAGFYKKVKGDILVLDLGTFDYRPPKPVRFESVEAAMKEKGSGARLKALVNGSDGAARYAWRLLSETLLYAARRVPEISDDIVGVDRALKWGFNWDLGPFEAWDAIGVAESCERLRREGKKMPPLAEKVLATREKSFYARLEAQGERRRAFFDLGAGRHAPVPERPGLVILDDLREGRRPIRSNAWASLWDLGDGVLLVEFHSKMNTISGETLAMVRDGVDEAERGSWAGLVIGNQAPAFSAGANLVGLAEAAKERRFDAIDAMIRDFHRTVLRMRYAGKPVVTAVQGLTLGGGCELALAAARVQAAAEVNMGLVELGVGLIPAGGGTRELACRAWEAVPAGVAADFFPWVRASFETVAQAKTSQSAAEARALGFLRDGDAVSMNRDRVLADAKRVVLALAEGGHRPPRPRREVRVSGRPGISELKVLLHQYREAGYASEHDVHVAGKFAGALCGGDIDPELPVTEEHLLDLEREVFLSLCGEPKTLERIAHTLKTGKPLRN